MNLSYSYYNQEIPELSDNYSIDSKDELYNMALSINNKNAEKSNKTQYEDKYLHIPYFSTQGELSELNSLELSSENSQLSLSEQSSLELSENNSLGLLEDNSSESEFDIKKDFKYKNELKHIKYSKKNEKHIKNKCVHCSNISPDILINNNNNNNNNYIDKEILLVFLIGIAIIFILDIVYSSRKR